MGKVKGFILTILGIPLLLFGMLILTGLTLAGIMGMAFILPAIVFASILLLTGAFLIFLGLREYANNKRIPRFNDIHGNSYEESYESNKGTDTGNKNKKIQYISLVIILVLITMVIILTVQRWDQSQPPNPRSEVSDMPESDIKSMSHLTNGTLIIANDGSVFNFTNPNITIDSNIANKFVVFNQDSTLHDFKIESLGIHSPILKEGDSYEFIVQDVEPGVYEYYCTIHPNKMRAIWTVTDAKIAG